MRKTRQWRVGLLVLCLTGLVSAAPGAAKSKSAGHRHAVKLPRPGQPFQSFGHSGLATLGAGSRLYAGTVRKDGKVVAVGETGAGQAVRLLVARFSAAGVLDHSFGHRGLVNGPLLAGRDKASLARAVVIQTDGKIVVVGSATDATGAYTDGMVIERYDANGRPDQKFGTRGIVEVLTGTSFGAGDAVAIAPGGQIIAAGSGQADGSGGITPRVAVVRLNPGGGLDTGFRGGGIDVIDAGSFSVARGVVAEKNGQILIAGSQAPGLQVTNALLARLTPAGLPDPSFASQGFAAHQYARGAAFSSFNALAVRANGTIVAVGSATAAQGQIGADALMALFSASGHQLGSPTYVPSARNFFATGTDVPGANAVAITAHGDVLASGVSANGVQTSLALWAFRPGGGLEPGFGSRGSVLLHAKSGQNSEGGGIALAPGGKLATIVGDESSQTGTSYRGLVAQYSG